MNRRTLGAATAGVIVSLRTSTRASAQPAGDQQREPRRPKSGGGRGGPIRIPVLLDLKKVPVGSWAEYTLSQGGRAPRTVRQVLVDRDQANATVEVILQRNRGRTPLASAERKVTRMVVDLELKELAPRKVVVQRSDADPIALATIHGAGRRRFSRLDPTRSLGSETVAVAAGTFQTQHYRDISPRGGTIDIWASNQVPPFGLVKLERRPSANAPATRAAFGQVTYALVRMGTGARPSITKPAKPLDPSLMLCRPGAPKRSKQ